MQAYAILSLFLHLLRQFLHILLSSSSTRLLIFCLEVPEKFAQVKKKQYFCSAKVYQAMRKAITTLFSLLLIIGTIYSQELPLLGRRGTHRPEWTLRRAAGGQDRGPGGNYFTGEKHQLVVLAEFADFPFQENDEQATIAQWNKILNTEHLNEAPYTGSARDYFSSQSYGQFNLVFDIQYVRVGDRSRYRSTAEDDENSQYLVLDVVDSLTKRDIQWNLYDWNGDGYINQLLIIYAGKGQNDGGDSYTIWPHQWWLSEHMVDRQAGVYYDPLPINYGIKQYLVDCYCAVHELKGSSGPFGTLCHEYSHCFGFPDFYISTGGSTVYSWDLMDYGCYNGGGYQPASYSAHERWLMGWLEPQELAQPISVADMPALEDEPVAYLIRNDGYEAEYYIVENRQKKGWDSSLPGSGILFFHIDYDAHAWLYEAVNTSSSKRYTLINANNKSSYRYAAGWVYPYEGNNGLTDASTPAATLWHANTDGNLLMSKPVTNIILSNGLASFDFMAPTEGIENVYTENSEDSKSVKCLIDGEVYIFRGKHVYNTLGIQIR